MIRTLRLPNCLLRRLCILLLPAAAAMGQSVDDELPLPRWEQEPSALSAPDSPGSQFNSLLPGSLIPALPPPTELPRLGPRLEDAPSGLSSQIGPTDLSLFLHGSLLGSARPAQAPRTPTPALSLRDLPAQHLPALLDAPANEYLIDPQNLVPEVERGDLERLLAFHASDARIRLYILVLDADQKLPEGADPALFVRGALSRQASCLAVYPLGEPWRARVFLSHSVHQAAAQDMLLDMAADCIRDSQQADDPEEQLQRYAIRLCTRLYWLQNTLPQLGSPPLATVSGRPLREVSAENTSGAAGSRLHDFGLLAGLLAGGLVAILLLAQGRRVWRSRRHASTSGSVWMLPEPEVVPRLGGAFSAGAGAVLSYKR